MLSVLLLEYAQEKSNGYVSIYIYIVQLKRKAGVTAINAAFTYLCLLQSRYYYNLTFTLWPWHKKYVFLKPSLDVKSTFFHFFFFFCQFCLLISFTWITSCSSSTFLLLPYCESQFFIKKKKKIIFQRLISLIFKTNYK